MKMTSNKVASMNTDNMESNQTNVDSMTHLIGMYFLINVDSHHGHLRKWQIMFKIRLRNGPVYDIMLYITIAKILLNICFVTLVRLLISWRKMENVTTTKLTDATNASLVASRHQSLLDSPARLLLVCKLLHRHTRESRSL